MEYLESLPLEVPDQSHSKMFVLLNLDTGECRNGGQKRLRMLRPG